MNEGADAAKGFWRAPEYWLLLVGALASIFGLAWWIVLLFTQFCDKADIVRKSLSFSQSKTPVGGWLSEIQDLRDKLAHANEYAASSDQAKKVCRIVRNLLALKKHMIAA